MTEAGMAPAPPDWPRAGDEIRAQSFGPFAPEALARYATVSGDDNPLHLDPDAAKAAGLAGTPVHGMLMLSCFEALLIGWRRDLFIARLSGRFLRPVLAGEGIRVSGRVMRRREVARPELTLRLIARAQNNDLAILAEATVFYKTPARLS
ncbi:MAG: MaoC family dehydratase [Methylocella sp.]